MLFEESLQDFHLALELTFLVYFGKTCIDEGLTGRSNLGIQFFFELQYT